MKYMIASDIHGSAWYARCLIRLLEKEGADHLLRSLEDVEGFLEILGLE